MGGASLAASKVQNGQFVTNLTAAGIDPKSVDMVVLSHFHGDHINGLLNADNSLAFPNAEVMVPAVEWKYFMDDGGMSRPAESRMQKEFNNAQRGLEAGAKERSGYRLVPAQWNPVL